MVKNNTFKQIIELGFQMNQTMDIQFILDKIIEEESLKLLSTKRAVIYLLDEKNEYLIPRASVLKNYIKQTMQENIPVNSSLSGKVVKSKKGMIFNNTMQHSDAYQIPGTSNVEDENLMVVPILVDNAVYGTINFYRDNIPYHEEELELARIFAMYASVAIQNSIKNEQLIHEIEERMLTEEKLKQNDERYKKAQQIGKVGNWEYNIQTDEFWGSDEAKRIYGFNVDDEYFSADKVESCIPDRKNVHQALIDLIEEEKEYNLEFDIITYDKQIRKTIRSVAQLEKDEDGNPLKVTGVIHDVTNRKNIEAKYKNVIEHSSQMFYIHDTNHILSYVSPQCFDLFGYTPDEMLENWTTFVTDSPINDKAMNITENTIKTGELSEPYFLEIRRKNGETRLLKVFESPIKNDSGEVVGLSGSLEDVTEIKKYEDELARSEERYRNFVKNASEGIYRIDLVNNISIDLPDNELVRQISKYSIIAEVNESLANMYGLTTNDMVGHKAIEFAPKYGERALKVVRAKNHRVSSVETTDIDKDGNEIYLLENFSAVIEAGKLIRIWGTQRDITDKKKIEKDLISKNKELELFATIFENLNECITVTDKEHKIFYVNKAFKKLYGYTEEEYLGKTVDFLRTDNDPKHLEKIKKATNNGGWSGEIINRKKDGSKFPIELSATRIFDKDKDVVARIGIVRDITERKEAEKALQESEARFKELFNRSAIPLCLINKKEGDLIINLNFEEVFGFIQQEVSTLDKWWDLAYPNPEYRESMIATCNAALQKAEANKTDLEPIEYLVTCKNGSTKNVVVNGSAIGEYYLLTFFDITDRKKAEEQYRALVENSTDAIYMVDSGGYVSFVNSYGAKMLGRKVKSVIGKNIKDLFPKNIAVNQKEYIQHVFKTGEIAKTDSEIKFPAGKIWLENILIPVFDDNQKVISTIGVSRNITEKKEYELELQKHRDHLEELVKERTEELEEKNRLLDSSVKVFVGREQTIINLKNRIKELELQLETKK